MTVAVWKDLVIDAVDAPAMARFWARNLRLEIDPREMPAGYVRLNGPTPQHAVWVASVPEAVTVKQRVHLDIHASSLEEVLDAGATAYDVDSFDWNVLRDPESGEFCTFVRDGADPRLAPGHRLYELGIDVAGDPGAIAAWWAEAFGGTTGADEANGWAWAENIPGAPLECLVFCRVSEPKTVKNRIHWDVTGDADGLAAAGATVLEVRDGFTVMADPEGNEFCVVDAR